MHREGNTAKVHYRKTERNTQSSRTSKANTATLPRRDAGPVTYRLSADNLTLNAQSDVAASVRQKPSVKTMAKSSFSQGDKRPMRWLLLDMQNLDASQREDEVFCCAFSRPRHDGEQGEKCEEQR